VSASRGGGVTSPPRLRVGGGEGGGGDELGRACNSRKLKDNRAEVTPIVTGSGSNGTADRTMLVQRDSLPPPFHPSPVFHVTAKRSWLPTRKEERRSSFAGRPINRDEGRKKAGVITSSPLPRPAFPRGARPPARDFPNLSPNGERAPIIAPQSGRAPGSLRRNSASSAPAAAICARVRVYTPLLHPASSPD